MTNQPSILTESPLPDQPEPEDLRATLWSTAHAGPIRALSWEHEGCVCELAIEPDNPVDADAVAILSRLPEYVVGGRPADLPDGSQVRIIGYIRRAEPRRAQIQALLRAYAEPLPATLILGADEEWFVRVSASGDDGDIPF